MCVIRIMPPLTLADLRLRSIHRKKAPSGSNFCRNRLTHCIYVVCIQCLIYTMMTPFDKRNMREINDFFPICRPGSSAACLDRRRGSSRRPHESKSLRHLLRHDIILFDPCEKLNCSEFLFRIFNSRQTCLFRIPLSPIFRKDMVSEFQRVIQDIFIVKRQSQSSTSPAASSCGIRNPTTPARFPLFFPSTAQNPNSNTS